MKTASAGNTLAATNAAVEEACAALREQLAGPPDIIFAHWSTGHSGADVARLLQEYFPDCRLHGASSCQGVMTEAGLHSAAGRGLALLGLRDPRGAYGVSGRPVGDNPRQNAGQAVLAAIADAGRPGEIPELVRIATTPGHEDQVVAGIEDVLGSKVPIIGGTAGDNEVDGQWEIIAGREAFAAGLTLAVLYPSTPVHHSFHNGYSPTSRQGVVTKAEGRTILEIDQRPAAQVYNEWTGGLIASALPVGGPVLSATTLHPLGREVGRIGGVPYYNLAHPERVTAGGGLTTFADIGVGEKLILMGGTIESLISRAGRVARSALKSGRLPEEAIAGALVTYCAGCMLTVSPRMAEVVASFNQVLGGRPFLGSFTFGEQGCFIGGENRHGNLMISVIIFSDRDHHGQ